MFNGIFVFGTFLTSLVCGLIIIPQIVDFCKRRQLFDLPDARKRHKTLVPRLGGICFLPCMVLSFLLATLALRLFSEGDAHVSLATVYVLVGAMMVYITGAIDDLVGVRATRKFIIQAVSACFLPLAGLYFNDLGGLFGIGAIPYYIGMPLTVLFVVSVDNAINLIDGIDGLCAGLSAIALMGFGLMFADINLWVYCVMIAGLIGVLLAYSYFNIFSKKWKIFMGDSGSLTLGFLLAAFFIKLSMNTPATMPYDSKRLIVCASFLMVPCFDVLRVMMARKRTHKPLFSPDRNHIHHRLIDAGCTPHQALGVILMLSISLVGMNSILAWFNVQSTWILALDIIVFSLFHYCLQRHLPQQRN